MPEEEYVWLPRESILRFEELARLTGIFARLGARKVRLTGGEPLLRQDLETLVELLAATPGVDDLALTTNGVLLQEHADWGFLELAEVERWFQALERLP